MHYADASSQLVIGFRSIGDRKHRPSTVSSQVFHDFTRDLAQSLRAMGHEVVEIDAAVGPPGQARFDRCDIIHSHLVGDIAHLDLDRRLLWGERRVQPQRLASPPLMCSVFGNDLFAAMDRGGGVTPGTDGATGTDGVAAGIETDGNYRSQGMRPGFDRFLSSIDGAAVVSYSRQQASCFSGLGTGDSWLIPNQARPADQAVNRGPVIMPGLDLSLYQFEPKPDGYLAAVSDFLPGCGLDYTIELATRIGVPFRFAGAITTAEQRDYFAREVRPRITRDVEYIGPLDRAERAKFLSRALCLVETGWRRPPFDLSAVEALAGGTPVVTTPNGAATELVVDQTNGFVASTPGELASAMNRLARIDRKRCRRGVEENFGIERQALELEAFYREAVGASRPQSRRAPIQRPPVGLPTEPMWAQPPSDSVSAFGLSAPLPSSSDSVFGLSAQRLN